MVHPSAATFAHIPVPPPRSPLFPCAFHRCVPWRGFTCDRYVAPQKWVRFRVAGAPRGGPSGRCCAAETGTLPGPAPRNFMVERIHGPRRNRYASCGTGARDVGARRLGVRRIGYETVAALVRLSTAGIGNRVIHAESGTARPEKGAARPSADGGAETGTLWGPPPDVYVTQNRVRLPPRDGRRPVRATFRVQASSLDWRAETGTLWPRPTRATDVYSERWLLPYSRVYVYVAATLPRSSSGRSQK